MPRCLRWLQLWQPIACGGRHVLVSCYSVLLISAASFPRAHQTDDSVRQVLDAIEAVRDEVSSEMMRSSSAQVTNAIESGIVISDVLASRLLQRGCDRPNFANATNCASHLRKTAIDEQLGAGDVARVIGSEKHRRPSHFVTRAKPAERGGGVNQFPALFTGRRGSEQAVQSGGIDRAGADRVHANLTMLQIRGPGARKGTRDRLGGGIDAVCAQSLAADN